MSYTALETSLWLVPSHPSSPESPHLTVPLFETPVTMKFNATEDLSSKAAMKSVMALNPSSFGLFQMRYPDKKGRENNSDDVIHYNDTRITWKQHGGESQNDMTTTWSIPKLSCDGAEYWRDGAGS